jgi:hypothetical protein
VPARAERAGERPGGLDDLGEALDLARAWAGPDRLALIASGSHAAGDAVWARVAGRSLSLSDLDLYAVVPDPAAKRAARGRAEAARAGLVPRLRSIGLAAPLEVAFLTPADLAALPARPGTLELKRTGRVVDGDPSWLERVPGWTARDVGAEEVWLLLENRGFELLWAAHAPGDDPLVTLQRRHAVLKCALELAAVMALAAGEYPEGAAARVAWATPRWDRSRGEAPPWEAALAWRSGRVEALPAAAAAAERLRTAGAWVALWRRLAGDPGDPARPFAAVGRVARRARLRRRVREALWPEPRLARLRTPGGRVRHGLAGTPRHRLHAAAAAQLILETALASGTRVPSGLRSEHRRVLRSLGVGGEGEAAGAALVRAWDRGFLDGQRTEGWA